MLLLLFLCLWILVETSINSFLLDSLWFQISWRICRFQIGRCLGWFIIVSLPPPPFPPMDGILYLLPLLLYFYLPLQCLGLILILSIPRYSQRCHFFLFHHHRTPRRASFPVTSFSLSHFSISSVSIGLTRISLKQITHKIMKQKLKSEKFNSTLPYQRK